LDAGDEKPNWGFTGEQTDQNGMIFLRARYYQPNQGRFLQRDNWKGEDALPISLNPWVYSFANPINLTDPTGYLPQPNFCLHSVFASGNLPITAETAVRMCQDFYSMDTWKPYIDCNKRSQDPWVKRDRVSGLFIDYLCELGPETVDYYANDKLTKELAKSNLVNEVRRKFYPTGVDIPISLPQLDRQVNFEGFQVFMSTLELIAKNTGSYMLPDMNITHFLGSVDFAIYNLPSDRIGIYVHNRTDLSSGTHFPMRYEPEYRSSVEDIISKFPHLKKEQLQTIVNQYPVISILNDRTRSETQGMRGGGNMDQVFVWSEKRLNCTTKKLPWPVYLLFTEYGSWTDYEHYIR
ncbi:MAG: RHS repeat-associated core domain-containing protein, partial [Anaerolineales bacterium]|nr:RHS repeat-associated core domain-containing protein [Anaerolineales bacterium]